MDEVSQNHRNIDVGGGGVSKTRLKDFSRNSVAKQGVLFSRGGRINFPKKKGIPEEGLISKLKKYANFSNGSLSMMITYLCSCLTFLAFLIAFCLKQSFLKR